MNRATASRPLRGARAAQNALALLAAAVVLVSAIALAENWRSDAALFGALPAVLPLVPVLLRLDAQRSQKYFAVLAVIFLGIAILGIAVGGGMFFLPGALVLVAAMVPVDPHGR